MINIFCYTCHKSIQIGDNDILYDNSSNMVVCKCPGCGTRYLAVEDEGTQATALFKLTLTKSRVVSKETSRIIQPGAVRRIIIPGER